MVLAERVHEGDGGIEGSDVAGVVEDGGGAWGVPAGLQGLI